MSLGRTLRKSLRNAPRNIREALGTRQGTGFGAKAGLGMRKRSTSLRKAIGSYKKGGTVKKTGLYKLHKGEKVVRARKKRGTKKRK